MGSQGLMDDLNLSNKHGIPMECSNLRKRCSRCCRRMVSPTGMMVSGERVEYRTILNAVLRNMIPVDSGFTLILKGMYVMFAADLLAAAREQCERGSCHDMYE